MNFDEDEPTEPVAPPSSYSISPNAMAFPTQLDPEPPKSTEPVSTWAPEAPTPWPPAEPALAIDKILAAAEPSTTPWSTDISDATAPLSGWGSEPAETPSNDITSPTAAEPTATWAPEPLAEVDAIIPWPTEPPQPAELTSPANETAPEAPAAQESGGPTLFERLNQQLQKGSISEIEPPPETSFEPSEPELDIAAPHGPVNPEATLVLKVPKELAEGKPAAAAAAPPLPTDIARQTTRRRPAAAPEMAATTSGASDLSAIAAVT